MLTELIGDLLEELRQLQRLLPESDPQEPLSRVMHMQAQLEALTAGLVGRARHGRVSWAKLARLLCISEDTARHRYTDAHIRRRLDRFTRPAAPLSLSALYTDIPVAPTARTTEAQPRRLEPTPPPRDPGGHAFNRLASMLSMLARGSRLPLKDIAKKTGCSPSYLSRVLNGERVPTWRLTERLTRACGADPAIVHALWANERLREQGAVAPLVDDDHEDTPLRAGTRLLAALRTLHVRVGQPTAQDIVRASRWRLSVDTVADMLDGHLTSWPALTNLLHVLGGDTTYFRTLWDDAQAERKPHPTIPASAFG
ncbi:helix-turn-helix domain-containing protein [Streptomyces sp. NPDC096339]|uniref:helix-turn-helix domain-containing protein n=1 Tax=Streptomyces sp. NPDC096339 TaxID=3366086 RepID=UPI00381713B2